MILGALW